MKNNTTVIAVDLAKTVFQIAVSETPGEVARSRRLTRAGFQTFFEKLPPAIVVMEACGSAHHWGRQLQALGHSVQLLPAHLVRPYVPRNKTDRADALGILEAWRNKGIHPVPVKTIDQQALGGIHRFRSGWIASRTAQVNTIRGLLREFGILIPVGVEKVVPQVRLLIEDADSQVPDAIRSSLAAACDEVELLDQRIKRSEKELESLCEQDPVASRLRSTPGIGLITGTALVARVGNVERFRSSRHFASYLGITPREHSSGLKQRFGRISKRGDGYLRMLLIHGARSVITHARRVKSHDRLREWALKLQSRTRHNKATVALANKIARIVWAVWKHERAYTPAQAIPMA
jgi:transposase